MNKINIKTLLFLNLFQSLSVLGQISQNPNSALTPNAANLGLFGDIPISLFTGTPHISLPLYNLEVGSFILPISIDYHSGGIRPDQKNSWVGLGWTLNAGGVVTRKVNDMPDEYNNPNYSFGDNMGYYYNYSVSDVPNWNQRDYLRNVAQGLKSSLKDTEPDEFSFYIPGHSGKFYLDHKRNWVAQCDKPIKIEFNDSFLEIPFDKTWTRANTYGYSPCFSGFTIITADGARYVFGTNIQSIDFSIDFFAQSIADWVATSWYLTKIILPTKQEIVFSYERKEFDNQMYIAVHHDLGSYTEATGGMFNPQPECSSWTYTSIDASYQGMLLSPVYLTQIASQNAIISFHKSISNELRYEHTVYDYRYSLYSKNTSHLYPFLPLLSSHTVGYPNCLDNLKSYKLDSIVVKDKPWYETHRTIVFEYDQIDTQRLVLNHMTKSGEMPYTFSYNNVTKLPKYLSNKTDHWGFYNNTYAALDSYSMYYNYRNPNAACAKYGILEKITYPTGGYTEFEFEPHDYRKQLNLKRWETCNTLSSNQLAGGVRIKKIKNYRAPNCIPEVKEYYYVTDYIQNKSSATVSSGVLGGQVQYYFDNYIVNAFNDKDIKRKISAFSSFSVLPACHNTLGCHIGYTEVVEKHQDNSFSRFVFTNFDNGHLDDPADAIIQQSRTPYEAYASKSMERGKLILREDFNSQGIKIKSLTISYEKDIPNNNYVRAINASFHNVCPGTAIIYDEGTAYKIYTYLLRPYNETEIFYNPMDGGKMQTISTNYTYTNNKLLSSTNSKNSNGNVIKRTYKYPADFAQLPPYDQMIEKNMWDYIVSQEYYLNNTLVWQTMWNYTQLTSGIFRPNICKSGRNTSETSLHTTTYQYNKDGNIIEIIGDDSSPKVWLWGYYGQYPIVEITNYSYSEVCKLVGNGNETTGQHILNNICYKSEPTTTDWEMINGLRETLAKGQVVVYKHKTIVGMTSMTDPRGITTYYDYDAFGRLKESYIMEDGVKKTLETYDYHYSNQ